MTANKNSNLNSSLYDILEISKSADQDTIKKAYKKLALQYHPDKNDNDPICTEKFREVNRAYQILSNPSKRKLYDRYGENGIKLLDQCEAQNVDITKFMNNPFLFYGSVITFLLTGCCFGCFCCCNFFFNCCCNFCCGFCKLDESKYENFRNSYTNENNENCDEEIDVVVNEEEVISNQPE